MRTTVFVALVLLHAISALGTVALVGRPRKPVTPGLAVATVVTAALMIAGLAFLWSTP